MGNDTSAQNVLSASHNSRNKHTPRLSSFSPKDRAALQAALAGHSEGASSQEETLKSLDLSDPTLRTESLRNLGARSISEELIPESTYSTPAASKVADAREEKTGFWRGLWNKVTDVASAVSEIAVGIGKGSYELVKFGTVGLPMLAFEAGKKLFTKEFWSGVGSAISWIGEKLVDPSTWLEGAKLTLKVLTFGPRLLAHVITHPVESLKTALSFGDGMLEDLGIKDIGRGFKKLLNGDISGAVQALKGAATAFCEFTCLADVWGLAKHGALALYCLGTGDKEGALKHLGQAAIHGAFVGMAVGAYVFTGGTGLVGIQVLRSSLKSVAKQALKVGVKEFLKESGEQLGKQLVERVSKNLSREVLEEAGQQMAREGVEQLASKHLGKDAARMLLDASTNPEVRARLANELLEKVGPKGFEKIMEPIGDSIGSKLMKKAGVSGEVEELTEKFVRQNSKASEKQLAKELLEKGFVKSEQEALELAKETKKVLMGAGKRSDAELAKELTDGIMKPFGEYVEQGVREGYEREMRSLLKGASKAQLDEAVEAGWKGAQRGLNKAMRKAVLEGVERGIKSARRKLDFDIDLPEGQKDETKQPVRLILGSVKNEEKSEEAPELTEREESAVPLEKLPRVVRFTEKDGRLHREVYVQIGSHERLEVDQDIGAVGGRSWAEVIADATLKLGRQMEAEQARVMSTNTAADDAVLMRTITRSNGTMGEIVDDFESKGLQRRFNNEGEQLAKGAVDKTMSGLLKPSERVALNDPYLDPTVREQVLASVAARLDFAQIRSATEGLLPSAFARIGIEKLSYAQAEAGLQSGFGAALERELSKPSNPESKLLVEVLAKRAQLRGQGKEVGFDDFRYEALAASLDRADKDAVAKKSFFDNVADGLAGVGASMSREAASINSSSVDSADRDIVGSILSIAEREKRGKKNAA